MSKENLKLFIYNWICLDHDFMDCYLNLYEQSKEERLKYFNSDQDTCELQSNYHFLHLNQLQMASVSLQYI